VDEPFGLRSISTFYGLTCTAVGSAAAVGPILIGRAEDSTGSYEAAPPYEVLE
jgi:hypothetical protein